MSTSDDSAPQLEQPTSPQADRPPLAQPRSSQLLNASNPDTPLWVLIGVSAVSLLIGQIILAIAAAIPAIILGRRAQAERGPGTAATVAVVGGTVVVVLSVVMTVVMMAWVAFFMEGTMGSFMGMFGSFVNG